MIPQLPTDNLYKFMALSGLFVLCFCIWIPSYLDSIITPEEIKAKNEMCEFISDYEDLLNIYAKDNGIREGTYVRLGLMNPYNGNDSIIRPGTKYRFNYPEDVYRDCINQWDNLLVSLIREGKPPPGAEIGKMTEPTAADKENKMSQDAEISEPEHGVVSPEVIEIARRTRSKLRQHSVTMENLWRTSAHVESHRQLSKCGLFFGAAIGLLGFIFWYLCVQRYQDKLIQAQAKKG